MHELSGIFQGFSPPARSCSWEAKLKEGISEKSLGTFAGGELVRWEIHLARSGSRRRLIFWISIKGNFKLSYQVPKIYTKTL
jgi:hypothetical protein